MEFSGISNGLGLPFYYFLFVVVLLLVNDDDDFVARFCFSSKFHSRAAALAVAAFFVEFGHVFFRILDFSLADSHPLVVPRSKLPRFARRDFARSFLSLFKLRFLFALLSKN